MNTSKTLIGLLNFSIACFIACSIGCRAKEEPSSPNKENRATESQTTANPTPASQTPANQTGSSPAETNSVESPRMLPTQETVSESTEPTGDESSADDGLEAMEEKSAEVEETETSEASIGDESTEMVEMEEIDTPSLNASKAFTPPAGAKALSEKNVWIDRKAGRVYADGYIAMNDGPLEMFACPSGTKEHESIVATLGKASELHAGLLAIGAQPGTPVTYNPSFIPATGQRIRVWVCYYDEDDKYQVTDARDWVVNTGTTEVLKDDWVFAGSYVWTDPVDNHNYYQGDVGDMICVSNFTTAMLDIPVVSSADTDHLEYSPNTPRIPERGTAIRLILEPIPLPADGEEKPKSPQPPTADVLKKR